MRTGTANGLKRRVVVTGMGVISPIGLDVPSFLISLKQGVSGQGPIQSFDCSRFRVREAFEVKGFDSHFHGTHLLDPFIQYAVAAAAQAVQEAGFDAAAVDPYRIGISVSSSKGGVHTIDRFKERFHKHPSAILGARIYVNAVPNFAAQWIARRWKVQGPAKCYVAACATGTVAVMEGARMVSEGIVDYCFAGASDASITPLMIAGYQNMKALSPSRMRPFDKRRDGFLVGEGAGVLFLETLESAQARGTRICGEIIGGAHAIDSAHPLYFEDRDDGLSKVLKNLFRKTELSPEEIDYVNLHGTATVAGDAYETAQIKKAFGKNACKIPMSSTKSMTGHMLGASGAVEIIASLVAMKEGFIPPTVGLEKAAAECDLDYTPLKARKEKVETTISISMGFGGHVAAIALRML